MHKKYGPIVRINPYELQVDEPGFLREAVYLRGTLEQVDWAYDTHGTPLLTLSAIDHNDHKHPRAAMNHFFSKANLINRQNTLRGLVSNIRHHPDDFATNSRRFHIKLGEALGVLTRDVATEFRLSKSICNLDAGDFRAGVGNTLQESGAIWRTSKYLRRFVEQDMTKTTEALRSTSTSSKTNQNSPPTVVSGSMEPDLPPAEKTAERLSDEVITVAGAAFETAAYTLSVTLYNVYSNPQIL
ncbi:hypothetical protein DL768_003666 [Monosporascus sp. mg162]|nr:hypothetical protein DL768_003666 [Monosporascus sp. mg162]